MAGGVEIRDESVLLGTPAGRVVVVVYCAPDQVQDLLAAAFAALARARETGTVVDPVAVRQRSAHEDEWRDKWKQFFRATRIGRRFTVRPSWDESQPEVQTEHVIHLDPGRAFGTGAHPSTKLVIGLCEDLADEQLAVERFADVGCGSGILAIAVSRLWPDASGMAVDTDPEAVACSGENLELNGVTSTSLATGSLDRLVQPCDLIVANIQADVLFGMAPDFSARLARGGRVVLSGLLISDAGPTAARFAEFGLRQLARRDDGEWVALVLGA